MLREELNASEPDCHTALGVSVTKYVISEASLQEVYFEPLSQAGFYQTSLYSELF